MKSNILKRLISLTAVLTFAVTGTAFAEENKISDSVLYYGQIENICLLYTSSFFSTVTPGQLPTN